MPVMMFFCKSGRLRSIWRNFSRIFSETSTLSSIINGGVSAVFNILSSVANTSISPVLSLGLVIPSSLFLTLPPYTDDVFATDDMGLCMNGRADFRVEDNLSETIFVAQVNENDPAMISSALYPSHQDHFRVLPHFPHPEIFAAGMGPPHITYSLSDNGTNSFPKITQFFL